MKETIETRALECVHCGTPIVLGVGACVKTLCPSCGHFLKSCEE